MTLHQESQVFETLGVVFRRTLGGVYNNCLHIYFLTQQLRDHSTV